MPIDDTELMLLLRDIADRGCKVSTKLINPAVESYFEVPDALLSQPPVSLAELLGGEAHLQAALAVRLKDAGQPGQADIVIEITQFLQAEGKDLHKSSNTHRRLLDYVYPVV